MAEFKAVEWARDKQLKGFYSGNKTTELGRASANVYKNSRGEWGITGFSVTTIDMGAYRNSRNELVSDSMYLPTDLGWANTLRDAKDEAEFWINRQVCMKNLDDKIMVDAV